MAVTTPEIPRVATRVGGRTARIAAPQSGTLLLFALLAACAYAVFASGAVAIPEGPRLQILVALIAVGASGAWLVSGTIRLRAPAPAWWGVGLLALFAAWCGISLFWSVAPDRSWAELNRGVAYALVVLLGIAAGASAPRVIERVATGWLAISVLCALYALGGKFIPAVDVLGLFDFDHTDLASRLRAPLEYWNALALVCVMGVGVAMRVATDTTRRWSVRLAGLSALYVLITTVTMSYSRGGVLATLVVIVLMTWLGDGARLRGLAVAGSAFLASTPVVSLAFSRPPLADAAVPLSERKPDGVILLLVFAGCLVALLMAGWHMLRAEERSTWSAERSAKVWKVFRRVCVGLLVVWLLGLANKPGGIHGQFEQGWDDFTKTSQDRISDPGRLTSGNSGNRWVWWKEAAGAWSDRPLEGWGAGSFPVTHKMFRKDQLDVAQPHNVPLQFLAETGLVGAGLALGGILMLLWAASISVRGSPAGRDRGLALALFAAAIAWFVHGFYDWDWDIPGVTVPAMLFLGVLAGAAGARRRATPRPGWHGHDVVPRAAGLVGLCVVLGVVMVSAGLPSLADSKTSDALALPVTASEEDLRAAAAEAQTAADLDPTSVRPLLAASAIAEGRKRLVEARGFLVEAVERQPENAQAWTRLLTFSLGTNDRASGRLAARRLLALDPVGTATLKLVADTGLFDTPPSSSPTATGTPLSPRLVTPGEADPTAAAPAGQPAPGVPPTPQQPTPTP